jgi:hypothetical protein
MYPDDEEDPNAQMAGGPPAPPEPDPAPAPAPDAATPTPEPDPMTQFAQYGSPYAYQNQPPPFDLPPPPQKEAPSDGPAVVGLLGDLLLNRGRNVPSMIAQFGKPEDTDYENWKRNAEYAKDRYALTAPRRGMAGAVDPRVLALRKMAIDSRNKALEMQSQGLGMRQQGLALRQNAQERELNTEDPRTKATRDYLYAHGAEPGTLEGLDYKGLQQLMPTTRQDMTTREGSPMAEQDIQHAAGKAGATSAATKQDRIDVARAGAQATQDTKAEPVDAFVESIKNNPDIRAHFVDDGAAMRARLLINPRGAQSAVDDIKANNRALEALDRLSAVEAEWKQLGLIKYAPKTGVASLALRDSADYQKAAGLEQEFHDLITEVQGVKARIAQTTGSKDEREESHAAMPGIGNFTASQRLAGTRRMLQTNTAANLSTLGMAPDSIEDTAARRDAAPAKRPSARAPNLGVAPSAGPKVNKVVGQPAPKAESPAGSRLVLPDGSSAADTPKNRAILRSKKVEFSVQ